MTPTASPRKRSMDRNNIQSFSFDENYSNVQTPVTTPEQAKPMLDYNSIGTQVAFQNGPVVVPIEPARPTIIPAAPVAPTPVYPTPVAPTEPIIKYVRYINEEEESSILEVTITEKGYLILTTSKQKFNSALYSKVIFIIRKIMISRLIL